MDILFIFPSLRKEEGYKEIRISNKVGGFLPPLGVASLAAYLIEKGFDAGILDPLIEGMSFEDIPKYVRKKNPKVIALSSVTSTFEKAKDIAKRIRKEFPEKLIIIGGHHITLFQAGSIRDEQNNFDIFTYGEGEITADELMRLFRKNNYSRKKVLEDVEGLKRIKGIMFRAKGSIIKTAQRELIPDLDILPMPARHLLRMEKYIPLPIEYKRLPTIHMMVSRGCPFSCTYCSTHAAFGYKVRFRSPEKVIEEIKHVIGRYGARQISFWDDVLTINKKWLMALCDLMIKEKLNIIWNCYAHPNAVDDEMLRKMKEAGCFCVWYGIEAGDDSLLKVVNKGTTVESVRKAVKLTKRNKIEIRGLFMIGLPKETPKLAQKTIDFAKELDVDYAQFSITTPHIGTKLYEDASKYGTLKKDFSRYTQHEAVFVPLGYKNKEEVEEMAKKAYKAFYHRPTYICKQFLKIRSIDDIKRYLRAFSIAVGL
jgi:radical SAM superfamily enzyme YgiQ (UPF0313 family)